MEAIPLTHIPNSSTPQWGRQNKRKKLGVTLRIQLKVSTAMEQPTLSSLMEGDSRDTGTWQSETLGEEGTLLPKATLAHP